MNTNGLRLYIREWRIARGLTQQALADAIGRDIHKIVARFARD